jgi:hypothetical protein
VTIILFQMKVDARLFVVWFVQTILTACTSESDILSIIHLNTFDIYMLAFYCVLVML